MSDRPTPETDVETMRDEYEHVDSDFGPFAPSDTVPADFARRLERERNELAELVDGAYIFVELHKPEGEYNKGWRERWLEKAKRLVPECDSIWY